MTTCDDVYYIESVNQTIQCDKEKAKEVFKYYMEGVVRA